MKKILKNILICVAILYLFVSMIYNIFKYNLSKESINDKNENLSNYEITIDGNTVYSSAILSVLPKYNMEGIVNNSIYNIIIGIVTSMIGIVIGLIISVKENSKIKYLLYFIFGNIIYTIIWLGITIIIVNAYVINYREYNTYLSMFIDVFTRTFISYIFIYSTILIANIIINKNKVEKLNKSLKQEEKLKENKINIKIIKKFAIAVLLIFITIFIVNTARKTIILNKYTRAMENINAKDNYYVKINNTFNDEKNTLIQEFYYKGNKYVEKNTHSKNLVYSSIEYKDEDKREYIVADEEYKNGTLYKNNFRYYKITRISNELYNSNKSRPWNNLVISLQTKIKSGKLEGKDCYIITIRNSNLKKVLFISKENNLLLKSLIETCHYRYEDNRRVDNKEYREFDYEYKFDVVTDEDVRRPEVINIK